MLDARLSRGAAAAIAVTLALAGGSSATAGGRAGDAGARARGWTKLPLPPERRDGAALIWTGSRVLAWGGCNPDVEHDCAPTTDGFGFDPIAHSWSILPPAPRSGAYSHGVWTGDEALFVDRDGGVAYDPASAAWRTISAPPPPRRHAAVHVWTGAELIVWGGGRAPRAKPRQGVAYDPATRSWRRIADAPIGLNLASGMWTGEEVLVFGSLLDRRNRAATKFSVGAAYNPAIDEWRRLPRSRLSPQATSAVWIGGRMVAWDYETRFQEYDPVLDNWTRPRKMPLSFDECYPASAVVNDLVFAFFCGRAALYDVDAHDWTRIRGGPLKHTIQAHGRRYKVWRFADLIPAGDVIYLSMEGITVKGGTPCYGCRGSPVSFWEYRPALNYGVPKTPFSAPMPSMRD
jgi:hypothetical protein